ncbi:MAG: hypothetical protein ACLSVD_08860 [Eggerthellaceae bacterium]
MRFAPPSIAMHDIHVHLQRGGRPVRRISPARRLAAVNLVFPLAMALGSIDSCWARAAPPWWRRRWGSDAERANRLFSFITIAAAVAGAVLIAVGAAASNRCCFWRSRPLSRAFCTGASRWWHCPCSSCRNVF